MHWSECLPLSTTGAAVCSVSSGGEGSNGGAGSVSIVVIIMYIETAVLHEGKININRKHQNIKVCERKL